MQGPRLERAILVVVTAVTLAACHEAIVLPVATRQVEVSPVYEIDVRNRTGEVLTLLPSELGRARGFAEETLPDGAVWRVLLQLRRFKVGNAATGILSAEPVPEPYLDAGDGPDSAVVDLRAPDQADCRVRIDLASPRWFEGRSSNAPPLSLVLTSCSLDRHFRQGPR